MYNKNLITIDGFMAAYFQNLEWSSTMVEAYEATEKEYQEIYKAGRRYSSYDSFRKVKKRFLHPDRLDRQISKKHIAMEQNENTKIVVVTINELRDIIREEFDSCIKEYYKSHSDQFMKRSEACEYLRITLPTLDQLFRSGELTKYQVSGRILVKYSEVQQVAKKVKL